MLSVTGAMCTLRTHHDILLDAALLSVVAHGIIHGTRQRDAGFGTEASHGDPAVQGEVDMVLVGEALLDLLLRQPGVCAIENVAGGVR